MNAYETRASFQCIAAGTTAKQVEAMGYREIAELAGVTIKPDGNSPADFFYVNIRRCLAERLRYYEQRGYLPEQSTPELDRLETVKAEIAVLSVEKAALETATEKP
jgi:hypothetical protein